MHDRVAAKQTLAAEHLPQHDAVGPDVGAAINRRAGSLLRAHVCGRAEDHPGLRHRLPAVALAKWAGVVIVGDWLSAPGA